VKKALIALLAIGLMASVAQADFFWTAGNYIYNSDGSTWATRDTDNSVGFFAQLIYAGSDGIANDISGTGTGVTGDDSVYNVAWLGEDGGSIDGVWWSGTGKTVPGTATEDGYNFYARIYAAPAASWNGLATTIDNQSYYYQGSVWDYDNDAPAGTETYSFDSAESGNWSIDTPIAVPEPTSVILALLGLGLVRLYRRK
jgi:hypothetical protein